MVRLSHSDDGLSLSVSLFQIADGLRGFAQRYVLSMTGVTFPDSMSSFRATRFCLLGASVNVRSVWLTNSDKTSALMIVIDISISNSIY